MKNEGWENGWPGRLAEHPQFFLAGAASARGGEPSLVIASRDASGGVGITKTRIPPRSFLLCHNPLTDIR